MTVALTLIVVIAILWWCTERICSELIRINKSLSDITAYLEVKRTAEYFKSIHQEETAE